MVDETEARRTAQDMKETVRDEARRTGETIRDEARTVVAEAQSLGHDHAEQRFEQGKGVVGGEVDTIHSAVDDAAQRLREQNSPLASYADELSGQLARFSSGIENSTLDDIAVKTRRVARENPGLFVLGSVVAGIAAGRFFKASSRRDHDDYGYDHGRGRDAAWSDDYRAGRDGAMSRHRAGYRSPAAGYDAPYRGDAGIRQADDPATTGRVPMDSSLAGGGSTTAAPLAPDVRPGATTGAVGTTDTASTADTVTGTAGVTDTTKEY